jgi:mannose-6-phosphate isomerase-like protein (cupin superfamily)
MKRCRLNQLPPSGNHVLSGLVPDEFIARGALRFRPPGFIAHPDEPVHAHDFAELFVILQGKAILRVDDRVEELRAGDVIVAEPNENHHLEIDAGDPAVYLFMQFGGERAEAQR